ncbi:serine/threonine-protein kinase [Saccharothrix variisporea]|uniref:non-specific serine/threonine protein kinase n=1 Tax=Saccharothrix variisporea TaxID=543527 RepID=A0A495X504_9PSEU|nr:serine/threonine-protein kinase [Saccharothrix variisporea]RKT67703.1 serine/threonine protein kinase [Saccharothrix variisporea]
MREVGNGRYRLVRELGRGGMGAVWLGHDTVLGRDVAVKELVLLGGVPAAERAVYQERVLREARIAGRLADPSVVTVYDLVKEDDQTYIVMELITAPTLDDLVDRDGPLDARTAATLAGQLLSALEAAHEAGVVHRDVKPGNVMVPARGPAKLTDFGIAQAVEDPKLTATGTLIGSPAYMAPERLSGAPASPAWDLWALGATLFYATEGRNPFERDTTSATLLAVMTERPRPRLSPGPLFDLVVGLLEPDPDRRLRAPQARRLIERALAETSDTTTHVDPPAPVGSFGTETPPPVPVAPRRRTGLILSATLTPLFVIGAAILLYATVFKPYFTLGVPDLTTATTTPSSPVRTSSPAMQPVLTVGPDGDIGVYTLLAFRNDCLNWVPAKGAGRIDNRIGCYAPHDVEVLHTINSGTDFKKEAPYPGVEALAQKATAECTQVFLSDKVIPKDKETTLRFWVVVPTEEAWKLRTTTSGDRTSDRTSSCYVGRADGAKLTEPVMTED